MRPSTIAACLALATATCMAFAQDPDAGAEAEAPASSAGAEPAMAADASAAARPTGAAPAPAAVLPAGDPQRGRALTFTCHGCHGVPGYENVYPTYRVPKIGGQTEVYLFNALMAYRNGEREHPTMQAQAESFSEAQIADIAAFLSSLQP